MTAASPFMVASDLLTPKPRRWATPGAIARACDPNVRQSPVLDLLDAELVAVHDDRDTPDRLMFFMPPQEGKSQRVSRWHAVWLLAHDPTLRIGIVSYELESAVRWGRAIKRDIEANAALLGVRLMADSKAAGRWETTAGGGVVCVGIRGALTGKPLDVLIIDDPVKDRAAAESRIQRDAAWEFWEQVAELRLSSRDRVVLIMTRWHADDLAGRLLAAAPGEWRVVSVPAISEGTGDPLGRPEGEELTSVQGRKPGHFTRMAEKMARYAWLALFQQRPSAAEGNLFKRGDWRYWRTTDTGAHGVGQPVKLGDEEVLRDLSQAFRFITCDLAASTRTSADYTVATAWAILPGGEMLVLDRVRDRVEDSGHWDLIAPLRARWLGPYDVTYVETAMFGTTFVYAAGQAGVPLEPLHPDKDKVTRALAAAPLVRQHRVHLPAAAPWLDEWLEEHAEFPNGTHDDQVDTLGYAARVALAHWIAPDMHAPAAPRGSVRYADDGLGGATIDPMTAAF